mgnify:CR=1 FL=1
MKVWSGGELIDLKQNQIVFIGRPGTGKTVFGEYGTFIGTTNQHLVFRTDSGKIVKTKLNDMDYVVGKAKEYNVFVSTKLNRDFIKYSIY